MRAAALLFFLLLLAARPCRAQAPGTLLWEFTPAHPFPASCPARGPDGTLYVADEAGKIYAVDPAARRLRWERTMELDARVLNPVVADASPAIGTNGVVYIGAQNGRLSAFDAATGSPR